MIDINKEEIKIVLLSPVYDLSDFDCGDNDLNEFIKEDALIWQKVHLARIYIMIYKEQQVVGFFFLSNDAIKLKSDERENTPQLKGKILSEFPSVKIGRLAIDKRFQGKKLGDKLLKIAIAFARKGYKLFGCRFVTVDSYVNAVKFYEKYGFVRNEHDKHKKKDHYVSMRFDLLNEEVSEEELRKLGIIKI